MQSKQFLSLKVGEYWARYSRYKLREFGTERADGVPTGRDKIELPLLLEGL